MSAREGLPPGGRLEWLWALAVVVLGLVAGWRLAVDGYLPHPFYYHVDQSLMDLYSTALWANTPGAYSKWHSVYPPLSFVFLDLFSTPRCYAGGALSARRCDLGLLAALVLLFLCNIWLVFRCYRWMRIEAAVQRTVAVCLGLPMLYALERGNLLIPCFTCFVLAFGDLLRWTWARWLALALAINFKPYLIFSTVPFVGRRAWTGLFLCGALFTAIFGITYLTQGAGSPTEVIANETHYANIQSTRFFSDIYFATSYWPLIRLLRAAPEGLVLTSHATAGLVALVLEVLIRLSQAGVALCCVIGLLRPSNLDVRRFGALVAGISLAAFTTGSSGYVQIFLLFLLFYEPWRGPLRVLILTAAYVLCLPFDLTLAPYFHETVVSFLSGREVVAHFGVTVGQLARPAILLVIEFGLIALNLSDLLASGTGNHPSWFMIARPQRSLA